MITLIIGGSNSGKSEYAENLLAGITEKKYYFATMIASDGESIRRVKNHRQRRADMAFVTVECPVELEKAAREIPNGCTVLLECIGNLAANELFRCYPSDHVTQSENPSFIEDSALDMQADKDSEWNLDHEADRARKRILEGIRILSQRSERLVIVSNEVNRAGCQYEGDTLSYQKLIGELNQELVKSADCVVEMVYGLAVYRKGRPAAD